MPTNGSEQADQTEVRRSLMKKLRRMREVADDSPEAKAARGEPLDLRDRFELKLRKLDQKIRIETRRQEPSEGGAG